MNELLFGLEEFFTAEGISKTYWIAYSGGLDSEVLLALCHRLRERLPIHIKAIHLNHQLSPYASKWAKHCQENCHDYRIPYTEKTLHLKLQTGDSLEAVARKARYDFFANLLNENDVLLTAHHEDDQAETVLLQLFRGAGPKGLAAMPRIKKLGKGYHARPLLPYSRDTLKQVALCHQLKWVEDESNLNCDLSRNFIRHELFPLLKTRWKSISQSIARSARHCGESYHLLDAFIEKELRTVKGKALQTLSVTQLLKKDQSTQRLLIRAWIEKHHAPMPSTKKLAAMIENLFASRWDRLPLVTWKNIQVRRYGDDVYLLKKPINRLTHHYTWNMDKPLHIESLGTLYGDLVLGKGLRNNLGELHIRFRQGGEKIALSKNSRRPLKKLFQEWKVLPWERDRIPLLFLGDRLISVVGYRTDPQFLVTSSDEKGYQIYLEETEN